MLTEKNTTGFTQEELDEMNTKVDRLMINYDPTTYGDRELYLKWAETKVLKDMFDSMPDTGRLLL